MQQIEHLTQKTNQQDEKERQLIQDIKEQKVESHNAGNEVRQKYETEVRQLSQKVKDLSEQVFELENQAKDAEQTSTLEKQEWQTKEQQMDRELQQLRELKEELTQQNQVLQKRFDSELSAKNQA